MSASLLGRCCSSEAANTNVLTWWQDSCFTELGKAALGIEVALRDRNSHTLNSGVSKVARGSESGVCEAVGNDSTSGAGEIGVEPCHLSVKFHFAFVDEIINNAPHLCNLLVFARELCDCHCRITQVNELAPEMHHVLMTFKCTVEGCDFVLNASICFEEEGETIISGRCPLWT